MLHPVAIAPAAPSAAAPDFDSILLQGSAGALLGTPMAPALAVPARALGAHAAPLLAALAPGERLAGALPFDRQAASHLLPVRTRTGGAAIGAWLRSHAEDGAPAALQTSKACGWILTAEPGRAAYEDSVARCVRLLRQDGTALRKVVLARTLLAQAKGTVSPWWLAQRLAADPHALRFVVPLPVTHGEAPAWLVGATPERLIARRGARILSEPLAGSAPRLPDAAASQARADALLHSAKDQQEHRYVVQAIADLLAPLCSQLHVPGAPSLYATDTMWHLGTRIEGELKDTSPDALPHASSAALAALLHPTPAVGGTPRAQAMRAIAGLEPVARGFYSGAVGWCDARGDGDWHVALRCAHVQGNAVRLFAGAGIVADSIPASEGAETRAKFNTMLHALCVDGDAPCTL
ncbi:isochorismate synthase DhbC [Comamonas faecalis]|uniref:isochorismate synthase n=1 Tax=Comamonas faecalis TaxID=1387849 RepID=A0ABP7R730_9BURK